MKGKRRKIAKRIIVSALVLALALSSVSVAAQENSEVPATYTEQEADQPETEETLPAASSAENKGEKSPESQNTDAGQVQNPETSDENGEGQNPETSDQPEEQNPETSKQPAEGTGNAEDGNNGSDKETGNDGNNVDNTNDVDKENDADRNTNNIEGTQTTPGQTQTPETTENPETTQTPSTQSPEQTQVPEAVQSPEPVVTPEGSQSPAPTQTPVPVVPEEEEDFSDQMSLEELTSLPMETVGATMFRMARRTDNADGAGQNETAVGDKWYFDAYYVNQSGRHDVTQTGNFNLKYQMEFHASQDLAPGAVLIRIKKEIYEDRDGNSVLPTDIGVPRGTLEDPQENRSTPFNYYEEGEYLVFFNYRKISSGTNAAWQVLYKNQKLMNIEDETDWTLTPEISVDTEAKAATAEDPTVREARTYAEAVDQNSFQNKTPLTGKVDSSVSLTSVIKSPYSEPGKNYTPGLYTVAQVERYIKGSLPAEYKNAEGRLDTANWRFVVWDVKVRGNATQPWRMEALDSPGVGDDRTEARVVGYLDHSDTTQYKIPITEPQNSNLTSVYVPVIGEKREETMGSRFYVVTAYPAAKVVPDTIVQNDISIKLIPADGKDAEIVKAATPASWSYKDYDWSYSGETLGVDKWTDETVYTGWLDAYRQSATVEHKDYGDMPFHISTVMHGYAQTHRTESGQTESGQTYTVGDYIPGRYYTVTTVDDFMYVHPTGADNESQMMKGEDYYFSSVTINQQDFGYDVWEDEKRDSDLNRIDWEDLPEALQRGSEVRIYAMLAAPDADNGLITDGKGWTLIDTVYLNDLGQMWEPYVFAPEIIAQKPWRVKVEHDAIDFESVCNIDVTVRLRHDSPKMQAILAARQEESRKDSKSVVVRFENLMGAMAVTYQGTKPVAYAGNKESDSGNYSEPGLAEASKELYKDILPENIDILPARWNAFRDVTWLNEVAHAEKKSSSTNDVTNNRVLVDYYLTAYDGYEIYDRSCLDYLKKEDVTLISPGRSHVVFYDLLPYGVQFDASAPVTAGRVTDLSSTTYQTQPKSWDKTQVTVTVDPDRDIIPDYRGTGRTMVAFHIAFSGAESTSYTAQKWIEGWGVTFRAYYEWKDMDQLNKVDLNSNIAAFMPDFTTPEALNSNIDHPALCGMKGEVDYDDGTHGEEDAGERAEVEEVYRDMVKPYKDKDGTEKPKGNIDGYNPVNEGKEFDKTYRNVLYAKNPLEDDVATSSTSKIEKLVHADADRLGAFAQTATVPVGDTTDGLYTYDITVTAGGSTSGIVVFDRLEKAVADNNQKDPFHPFEGTPWSGKFVAIDTSALDLVAGLKDQYTVYYNASEDAQVPSLEGNENPREILNSGGWLTAETFASTNGTDWTEKVKAVAVDMGDYVLEPGHSVSFRIKMQAPQGITIPKDGKLYAYNNARFSSCSAGGAATDWKTVAGNSVRVGLSRPETLEIVKKTAGNVPSALLDETFQFRLYEEYEYDGEQQKAYLAYTEYKLYKQNRAGGWDQQTGQVYATDGSGYLYLHADEKAVFEVADAGRIQVKETENVFWESRTSTRRTELVGGKYVEDRNGSIHTLTVTNTYRPVLYVQKAFSAIPAGTQLTDADQTFTFQIRVKGRDGQLTPLAKAEYWKVDSVRLDGGIPQKLETEGVLKTDENGRFTIKQGEIIALFPGIAGTEYELSEIEPQENWNWYCENMTLTGELPSGGDSRTITNYYRWKNLLLTKEITHQTEADYLAGVKDESDTTGVPHVQKFTFRIREISKDANGQETLIPAAGKEWILLGENGSEIGTVEAETAGTLNENGEFSCAFGFQTVKIKGLEAGKTYLIEELMDGIATENGKPLYIPNNDSLEVKMPVYSTQKGATFTNDYQKRPLSVTKTVVNGDTGSNDNSGESDIRDTDVETGDGGLSLLGRSDVQDSSLTTDGITFDNLFLAVEDGTNTPNPPGEVEYYYFTVSRKQIAADGTSVGFTPVTEGEYTVTKPGVPDQVRSIENGRFKLAAGETAVFKDFGMLGDEFIVTEVNNDYQIYPSDKAPFTGTISGDGSEAGFINGTPGMLMISKEYVGIDDTGRELVEEWKTSRLNSWLPDKRVKLILEVNTRDGIPYTEEIYAAFIDQNATNGSITNEWITPGEVLEINPWVTIILSTGVNGLPEGATYTLTEAEESQHRIVKYSRWVDIGDGMQDTQTNWMQISQSTASEALATASTVTERPLATIYNEVSTIDGFEGSRRGKEMTSGSDEVPAGAVLVWRLEKYDTATGNWNPAGGVSYAIFDERANPVSDRVQTTGADGRIRLVKEEGHNPWVWFTKDRVYLNLYKDADIERLSGQNNPLLRLVEVPEESDAEWGMLAGYRGDRLVQSGQEMLSQANQSTQGVLSLYETDIVQSVIRMAERTNRAGDDPAGPAGSSFSMNLSPDIAAIFVNSNRETAVEVEKSMNTSSETAFTFVLKQVLSTNLSEANPEITKENYQTTIVASEPRDGITYSIHNADGSLAGTGVTGPNGEFKLYAGQYASLKVPDGTMWTVSEKTSAAPTYTLENLTPDPGNGKLTKLDVNLMLINLPAVMKYRLIFDDNGGTGGPGILSKTAEGVGEVYFQIPNIIPTKAGYEFKGWDVEPSASTVSCEPGDTLTVTSETTLYAVWEVECRLILDYNDETGRQWKSENVTPGTDMNIPELEMSRPGHKFLGWNADKSASSAEWQAGEQIKLPRTETLYAVWKEITYTVRYTDGVEGESVFFDQGQEGLKPGVATPEFGEIPTRAGYIFMGWAPTVNPVVSPEDVNGYDNLGNPIITYTATWQKGVQYRFVGEYYIDDEKRGTRNRGFVNIVPKETVINIYAEGNKQEWCVYGTSGVNNGELLEYTFSGATVNGESIDNLEEYILQAPQDDSVVVIYLRFDYTTQ
ncbi:MAG: hypothetical protein HFH87_04145 [Lachnospiraceae bacterium]|nr:hypothetical protein [Lachnospiraceae bacterium]